MSTSQHEEKIHPSDDPDASPDNYALALSALVDYSATHPDVAQGIHAPIHSLFRLSWIHALIPGIEKLAAAHHVGNYVLIRETREPVFESMSIYARVGMHLLFYGRGRAKVLGTQRVENLLREQSIKEGRIYDSPESVASIPSFVKTYKLDTSELLQPDLTSYKSFNEFFTRKLKPGARSIASAHDAVCSAADSRLSVYRSADSAKQFWIKGAQFTIPALLALPASGSPYAESFTSAALAIFRLAPADYHRFHAPIDCTVREIVDVPGQYYTVNPQAVNEPGFDVLTANRRSILYLEHNSGKTVAVVAIGALLVGSVVWTDGAQIGRVLKKGDELGYFAYGGSTVVVTFPEGLVEFDKDIVQNSMRPIETLVKVGEVIGKITL